MGSKRCVVRCRQASPVRVTLPGGDLVIAWAPGGTILMSGPAAESYRGTFDWDDYAVGAGA